MTTQGLVPNLAWHVRGAVTSAASPVWAYAAVRHCNSEGLDHSNLTWDAIFLHVLAGKGWHVNTMN